MTALLQREWAFILSIGANLFALATQVYAHQYHLMPWSAGCIMFVATMRAIKRYWEVYADERELHRQLAEKMLATFEQQGGGMEFHVTQNGPTH